MEFEDEKTEELLGDEASVSNPHQHKKLFLIIGGVIAVLVIIGLALFLPGYLKASQLHKALELGEQYLEEGQYQEAILTYNDVLAIDEKNVGAYEGIATSYLELKDYTQAEKTLETVKSIDYSSNGKVLMSQVLINTDREAEAQALLNEAYDNPPQNAKLVISMLDEYLKKRDYDKVIAFLEKAIDGNENRKDLILLYDKLYYYYLFAHRSDDEVKTLVDKALKATGDPRFNILIQTDFKEAKTDTVSGVQLSDIYYKIPYFRDETPGGKKINETYLKMEAEWQPEMVSSMERYLYDPIKRASNSTYSYVNTDKVDCYISYNQNNLISILQNRFTYYGGPHGYDQKIAHTFNLKTGAKIDKKDFFCITDEAVLRSKLTDEFANLKNNSIALSGSKARYYDVDLADVSERILTKAVYRLTDEGLSVMFNAYDVACYATGPVEIIIPYTRTDLLNPIKTLAESDAD